jgi:hypothetical protein
VPTSPNCSPHACARLLETVVARFPGLLPPFVAARSLLTRQGKILAGLCAAPAGSNVIEPLARDPSMCRPCAATSSQPTDPDGTRRVQAHANRAEFPRDRHKSRHSVKRVPQVRFPAPPLMIQQKSCWILETCHTTRNRERAPPAEQVAECGVVGWVTSCQWESLHAAQPAFHATRWA